MYSQQGRSDQSTTAHAGVWRPPLEFGQNHQQPRGPARLRRILLAGAASEHGQRGVVRARGKRPYERLGHSAPPKRRPQNQRVGQTHPQSQDPGLYHRISQIPNAHGHGEGKEATKAHF